MPKLNQRLSSSLQDSPTPPPRLQRKPASRQKLRQKLNTILDSSSEPDPNISASNASASGSLHDDSTGPWYAIKDIIGERYQKRRRQYKVDWADNPETGESYAPTWIPARDATVVAVNAWKAAKQRKSRKRTASSDIPSVSATRKRSFSASDDSEAFEPPPKRPGQSCKPALLSSQVSSREPSTESSEPDPAEETGGFQSFVVELNPGSDFNPDDYARFSQLTSQSQTQSQTQTQTDGQTESQAESQSQSWSQPSASAIAAAVISQASHQSASQHTIPDSEDDTPLSLSALPTQSLSGSRTPKVHPDFSSPLEQSPPSVQADIPSHQPENSQNNEELAVVSLPDNSLRDSVNWDSPPQSVRRSSYSVLPWDPVRDELPVQSQESRPADEITNSQTGDSGHIVFLTQPDPDLLSDIHSQGTVVRTPVTPEPLSGSHSVIPDSTRPVHTESILPSAQLAQYLHANNVLLSSEFSLEPDQNEDDIDDEGLDSSLSASNSRSRSRSLGTNNTRFQNLRFKPLSLEPSVHRPRTPSQLSGQCSSIGSIRMDSGEPGKRRSAVDILNEIRLEAYGDSMELQDFETTPEITAEVQRIMREGIDVDAYEAELTASAPVIPTTNSHTDPQEPAQTASASPTTTAPVVALSDSTATGIDVVHPLLNGQDLTDLGPATIDTAALLPHPDTDTQQDEDVAVEPHLLHGGDDLSAGDDMFAHPPPSSDQLFGEATTEATNGQTTIAPSALSLEAPVHTASPQSSEAAEEIEQPVAEASSPIVTEEEPVMHHSSDVEEDAVNPPLSPSNPNSYTHEYIVTLPLAANSRQRYIDQVMEPENQKTIKEYSQVFTRDVNEVPSPEMVAKIDDLLLKLLDLSDLPPFWDSLPSMETEVAMKHAVNTNSKYLFVHEFLEALSTQEKKVLILARNDLILNYLEAIVSVLNLPCRRLDKTESEPDNGHNGHLLSVILADTKTPAGSLPRDIDIVIGFDHTGRTSGLVQHFVNVSQDSGIRNEDGLPKPLALQLITAFALEHIDLKDLPVTDDFERKNALVLCTVKCLSYFQETYFDETPIKPHLAAEAFASMIKDPTKELDWKGMPIPDSVFDIYLHSSGSIRPQASQELPPNTSPADEGLPNPRKRQLDDDEQDEEAVKRTRIEESLAPITPEQSVRVSSTVKAVLGGPVQSDGETITISLAQLEALALKTTNLETQLQEKESLETTLAERVRTLDKLVKDSTATIVECQRKMLDAVKDRGVFEVERDKAIKEAETAKEKLSGRDATIANLKAQTSSLETKLADAHKAMAQPDGPEAAQLVAAAQEEAQAATQKQATLERKVNSAETDLAHARRAYQDASNAAADLSSENRDLSARVKELDHLASENLKNIHQMNLTQEAVQYRRQWDEMNSMLLERERDLEWTREELRVLKNGRRETRAQSVPRSPRLGMMSPRTVMSRSGTAGPGGGGGSSTGGGGNGRSSSVSRGNSPGVGGNLDPTFGHFFPVGGAGAGAVGGASGSGGNGTSNLTPVPGMTYFNPQQGGGRWGHLRD